jgi:hypothetical protein
MDTNKCINFMKRGETVAKKKNKMKKARQNTEFSNELNTANPNENQQCQDKKNKQGKNC